ncbi:unnamed protein product [Caenorhabditis bovis]|uniref:Uncharacterized protein n=1 Tax=Caenorhabditis bovis TaxID=2654633 RepID=A0A8S1ELS8_9PELO|nr:unnamed protein product [Caenorhabditis bovis]
MHYNFRLVNNQLVMVMTNDQCENEPLRGTCISCTCEKCVSGPMEGPRYSKYVGNPALDARRKAMKNRRVSKKTRAENGTTVVKENKDSVTKESADDSVSDEDAPHALPRFRIATLENEEGHTRLAIELPSVYNPDQTFYFY